MASFDSLVNGTHTLAMWTITVTGPGGKRAARLREAIGPPIGLRHHLRDGAGGVLELQRHAVGIAQHGHRLPGVEIDAVQGLVQLGDFGRFQLAGEARLPSSASLRI